MLRNKQHAAVEAPLIGVSDEVFFHEVRVEVLADLLDTLDLRSFLLDPDYRRRLNTVLACFSDEEFETFERLYTRRFTVN